MSRWVIALAVVLGCDGGTHDDADAGVDLDGTKPTTSFTVTPLMLLGNGRSAATLTVTLEAGAGQPVTLTSDPPAQIVPASGVTDANGKLVAKLTATATGVRTLTATSGTTVQTAMLDVTPACPVPLMPGQPALNLVAPVAGDFNNDGAPDLVGLMVGGIGFASGNSDGSFQAVQPAVVSIENLMTLVAGDFDADGVLDLAGAGAGPQTGMAVIYKGTGTGAFMTGTPYPVNVYPTRIVAADFDHDGHVDLALMGPNQAPPPINVLFGNGNGTFQTAVTVPTSGSVNNDVALLAIDLNGDGSSDLVSSSYYSPRLTVTMSNGDRTFRAPFDIPLSLDGVGAIAGGDLNEDGHGDVIVNGYYPAGLCVLLGDGTGTFPMQRTFAGGQQGIALATADVDQDANLDVLVSDGQRLLVQRGDGNGGLQLAASVATPGHAALSVADFDKDGHVDLALDSVVVLNNASGGFAIVGPVTEAVESSAAGDFDGDGKLDLATVPMQNFQPDAATVSIRRGNGDGTFGPRQTYVTGDRPRVVLARDFNNDGKLDLAVSTELDVTVLVNNGLGGFTSSRSLQLAGATRHWGFVTGDFNRDGNVDLAVATEPWVSTSASLDVALGTGTGTFGATTSFALPVNSRKLAAGEFRGNGLIDIVVGPALTILAGAGDGTFAAPVIVGGDGGSFYDGGIAVADLDTDGNLDVLETSNNMSVRYGFGDGTFTSMMGLAHWQFGNPHLAADVDGDGVLDVIGGDAQLNLVLGASDGTFGAVLNYPGLPTNSAQRAVVGDWNADGLLDVSSTGGLVIQRRCTP